MSSNAEQAPNAGAQAGVGALLMEIGKRAPSPTQAVKVCQILGLATRENIRQVREISKNKDTPQSENKKPEGKMVIVRGPDFYWGKLRKKLEVPQKWLYEKVVKELTKRNAQYDINADQVVGVRLYSRYSDSFRIQAHLYLLEARFDWLGSHENELKRWEKEGWPILKIHVKTKKLFYLAKVVGAQYEKRVNRNCVTIVQDYLVGS